MATGISDLNHGNYERVACLIFVALIPTFLFTRFWSRLLSKQVGSDDWAALAAGIFALSCSIQTLVATAHGWGRHKVNLDAKDLRLVLILHWTFQITYKITVGLNKTSMLLLYLRIMPQRISRITCWTLLTLIGLFAFATTVASIFQCIPVEKAWIKSKHGHCYSLTRAWYANAGFSIATDFIILFLPMHMVYNLHRAKREKILLYAVFGVGMFVTSTSIMRTFMLKGADNPDITYDVKSGFWSLIEINVGVICICLPPLRALLSRQFPSLNFGISGSDPHPQPYLSSSISAPKSGGSTGIRKGRGQAPLESEEELVYFTDENSLPLRDNGIKDATGYKVTDMGKERERLERVHVRLLHWERQER